MSNTSSRLFGEAVAKEFLSTVREQCATLEGQESLYDKTRSMIELLIHADRPEEEINAWRNVCGTIAAYVGTVSLPEVDYDWGTKLNPCLRTQIRFDALKDMLADQAQFKRTNSPEMILSLPFSRQVLNILSQREALVSELEAECGLSDGRLDPLLKILAQSRLIDIDMLNSDAAVEITEIGRES